MELHLVIEADGGQHGDEKDEKRNAWFRANGFTILHFWNNDVLAQTEAVLEQIRLVVDSLSKATDEKKKP
jgi:very-short-patch-repair endonuclease